MSERLVKQKNIDYLLPVDFLNKKYIILPIEENLLVIVSLIIDMIQLPFYKLHFWVISFNFRCKFKLFPDIRPGAF